MDKVLDLIKESLTKAKEIQLTGKIIIDINLFQGGIADSYLSTREKIFTSKINTDA